MKKILAVWLCSFVMIGCFAHEIDLDLTARVPWKVGEKVADLIMDVPVFDREREREPWVESYRIFLGVTSQGYYLVQEFYKSNGNKVTSPYTIKSFEDVTQYTEWPERLPSIIGSYQIWYPHGSPLYDTWINDAGKEEGTTHFWYENGQLAQQIEMKNGVQEGDAMVWGETGVLAAKGRYANNQEVGVWQYWDLQDELVTEYDWGQ